MLTEMMRQMLPVIATEGDYGFLMAADEFENSADPKNQTFGRLLRTYVDIQTYVRMSQPIPLEMEAAFTEANKAFNTDTRQYIDAGYYSMYTTQLGPFYLELKTTQAYLASNMNWLEQQPVRHLVLSDVNPLNVDLKMIVRNHRIGYQKVVTLQCAYNARPRPADMGQVIKELAGNSLRKLYITRFTDNLGICRALFQANRSIPKGAELYIETRRVHVKV